MLKKTVIRESSFWGQTSVVIMASGYGFVMVTVTDRESDVAVVHDLVVHKGWRRKGLGNALLEEACEEAYRMGADVVRLSVEPDSWQEGWYSRHGFRPTESKVFEDHALRIMEKEIEEPHQ